VPPAGVVVLLGAPGVGTSLLAAALQEVHSSSVVAICNVGQQLRGLGLVDTYATRPSEQGRQQLQAVAKQMLADSCSQLQVAAGAGGSVSSPAPSSRWVWHGQHCKTLCSDIAQLSQILGAQCSTP
jgi:hypothetical protein